MRGRIKIELAKFEKMLEKRWKKLFRPGAVFRLVDGGMYVTDCASLFETVAAYSVRPGMIGPHQHIFVREQGSGVFSHFDDRAAWELSDPLDVPACYLESSEFLRCPLVEQFTRAHVVGKDIRREGTVFSYFNNADDKRTGLWETVDIFASVRRPSAEIVIARNHGGLPRIAEFSAFDLPNIDVYRFVLPRYISKTEHGVMIPVLDIYDGK